MTERFLIDSTIWVKYLRGLDPSLKEKLGGLVLQEQACTTEVIIMEILRGARSDKDYEMLRSDFSSLPLLETTPDTWEKAWKTAYSLRMKGINAPLTDILIASIALHYKCTVLHSDKHFQLIAQHTGLKETIL